MAKVSIDLKATVSIKRVTTEMMTVKVIGNTPLLTNKMDIGSLEKTGTTEKKRYPTSWEKLIDSLYWIDGEPEDRTEKGFNEAIANGARFGIKAIAFKMAAIDAAYSKGWVKTKKALKGMFNIVPDKIDKDGNQLVEIKGDKPIMYKDVGRTSGIGRTPVVNYRGMFQSWYCDLTIRYDIEGAYGLKDIIAMIEAGGIYNGVGDFRPECNGQFGMYHIVSAE